MLAKETAPSGSSPKMLAAFGLKLRFAFRFSLNLMCDPDIENVWGWGPPSNEIAWYVSYKTWRAMAWK